MRNGNEQQQMSFLWSNYGTVITDRNRTSQQRGVFRSETRVYMQEYLQTLKNEMNEKHLRSEKIIFGNTVLLVRWLVTLCYQICCFLAAFRQQGDNK